MSDLELSVRAAAGGDGGSPRNGHRPRGVVRRPLPGGRAVVGGLLVATSAIGLYSASTRAQAGPTDSYVVVRHAVAPGARLRPQDLNRIPLELPPSLAQRAFRDSATLEGATVVAPLAAGDLVQSSAVVAKAGGPASREVTFSVPRTTLAAALEQGERIDVVATFGSGPDAYSAVVLRQALVVHLDRGRERAAGGDDAAVTVAVDDPGEALALAHAIQLGKLTVVRATGAPPLAEPPASFRQPGGAPGGGSRP